MKKQLTIAVLLATSIYGDSISYLNSIRSSVGLNTLSEEIHLKRASTNHAKYLVEHSINSHYEKDGKYFTGKTPSMRVIKSGYPSKDVKENIATNAKSEKEAIDILFSAIYHRFVFLDFDIDQVGVGISSKDGSKSAYVYDMGLSSVAKLCSEDFLTLDGEFYIQNLCRDEMKYVPKSAYQKAKKMVEKSNPKMVIFPPNEAKEVIPAFFDETPHPMPGYKVSGYPVSVELNPYYYQDIKVKKFRLYDSKGKMIRVKLLKSSNDRNHKLKPYEFAIIPKQRLEYNSNYKAYFEAYTDKGMVKKEWHFKTKSFDKPFYKIEKDYSTLKLFGNRNIVLYFKPKNRKDVITKIKGINTTTKFIDANTVEVKVLKFPATIELGRKKLIIK